MPTFELCVLGSPSLHGVSYGRRTGVAGALSEQLPELGAAAMRQVAIDDLETDSGSWPVFGRFLEPTFAEAYSR